MRKSLLKSMVAVAALCLGAMNVSAQDVQTAYAFVKMTYISGSDDNVDVAYGVIPEGEPAFAGYNKISGDAVALANKGWGVNNIAYLCVDASSIPGVITKATLTADFQQIAARGMNYGVGYNDSKWSAEMTWNTADRSITLMGTTQSTAKATDDVELSFDITDAMKYEKGYIATVLVYNTAAGAGYIKNPVVEVEYEPYEATSTKYDFEDGTNPFIADSRISMAIEDNATVGSKVLGWTCASNAQNGYSFSHFDFTSLLNQPALVKVEFDYYNTKGGRAILNIGDALVRGTTGGSSKVTYNSTGVIFSIGSDKGNANINGQTLPQDDVVTTYKIYSEELEDSIEVEETKPGLCDKWMHVTLIVNNDVKTVAWVVDDMEGDNLYYGVDPFYATDANECTQIDLFGYINNSHCAMIDNLEITNYKSNAVFADYTIKYVDGEGNEIKEARTGNGQVGKFVTLLDSDKAAVYAADNSMKYIYLSDDSETTPITEEGTVITVTFRDAEKYYAVLNCKAGSTILKQFRDLDKYWFWEGDTYTLYPSRFYKATDGTYWGTEATDWNGATFTFPGIATAQTVSGKTYYVGTLNYVEDATVAYYANFEDLALPVEDAGDGTGLGQLAGSVNNWWSFANGYFSRFSGGRAIRLDAGSYVWTEPIAEDGTYMVRIYGRNDRSANCEAPYALGLRDAEGNVKLLDVTVPDWASATTGESIIGAAAAEATEETEAVEAAGIGIPAGNSLVVMNTGNGGMISLDDIKLTKVADYAETPSLNIYTATFTTDAEWENVYAYAWTTTDEVTTEFLGTWPGTQLKATDGVYSVSIIAAEAPANIIFNNGNSGEGNQTQDLVFTDGKAYAYLVPVKFPETATVFDFEAAAAAGENPANKNGSAASGQAFYGWENADKTDSKRQDYKGYEWAEGSVLPNPCQVWRRSDRINGNVKDYGLYCPNNREMAVDGLNVGDKVIVVYTAMDATDKELTWAIGDGTSSATEENPAVVRATATIDGVEAVTGETTIASGAEILVNSVTPAENGTGYIVFQVKKGMYIRQIAVVPAEVEVAYYLVGNMNEWTPAEAYKLELNTEAAEGVEEYMINVDLAADAQFKVVKVEGENPWIWYPDGTDNNYGQNGELKGEGNYNVYFRPNGDGDSDWFYNFLWVVDSTTDGINYMTIDTQNAVIYNMQGIRVAQPTKGLYIQNGKKVVIK